jgi:DNA-binding transcriptional regulator YdaS (Cro superfamily)
VKIICGQYQAMESIIDHVIERAGGVSKLAAHLGLWPSAMASWKKHKQIPAQHCRAIAELTGISVHVMRPDIFGDKTT